MTVQVQQNASENIKEKEAAFRKNLQSRPALLNLLSLTLLLVLSFGLGLDIYLFGKKMGGASLFPSTLAQKDVAWGIEAVFQVFVLLFFAEALIICSEIGVSLFFGWKPAEKDVVLMANSLLRDMVVAGFVIYLVKKRFRGTLAELGLTTGNLLRNVVTGIVSYLAMLPVLCIVLFLLAFLSQALSYEPPPQPVVEIYLRQSAKKYLIFFTLFVAIVGPLIEEVFFRGFAYKAFRTRFGVRSAMIVTALLFAFLHMNLVSFLPIFILGLCLAYLYETTGSLVPSMTLHMIHNLVMVGMTLGFKSLSV